MLNWWSESDISFQSRIVHIGGVLQKVQYMTCSLEYKKDLNSKSDGSQFIGKNFTILAKHFEVLQNFCSDISWKMWLKVKNYLWGPNAVSDAEQTQKLLS